MTPARRWPKAANEHRQNAMNAAKKIETELYNDLIDAINSRNTQLIVAIMREIKVEAAYINRILATAPAGSDDD